MFLAVRLSAIKDGAHFARPAAPEMALRVVTASVSASQSTAGKSIPPFENCSFENVAMHSFVHVPWSNYSNTIPVDKRLIEISEIRNPQLLTPFTH